MTRSTHRFSRTLLALALAAATGLAQAGALFHVEVDSTGYTGSGSLELTFLGLASAAPASATVSGFTGAFGSDGDQQGSVTGSFPGALVFSNAGFNDFWRAVTLGGKFGFDVGFDLPDAPGAGTTFAVQLANDSGYLGAGPVAAFELAPGSAPAVTVDAAFASVGPAAAVPEPASWTVVFSGVLMLVAIGRKKR